MDEFWGMLVEAGFKLTLAMEQVGEVLLIGGSHCHEGSKCSLHRVRRGCPILGRNVEWWLLLVHRPSMPAAPQPVKSCRSLRTQQPRERLPSIETRV